MREGTSKSDCTHFCAGYQLLGVGFLLKSRLYTIDALLEKTNFLSLGDSFWFRDGHVCLFPLLGLGPLLAELVPGTFSVNLHAHQPCYVWKANGHVSRGSHLPMASGSKTQDRRQRMKFL